MLKRCFWYAILYLAFFLIAKYTDFYSTGLSPDNGVSVVIAAGLIIYRFFAFTIIPACLFAWMCAKLVRN